MSIELPLEIQGAILSHLNVRECIQLLHQIYHQDEIYGWRHFLCQRLKSNLRVFTNRTDIHSLSLKGQPFNENSILLNSDDFERFKEIINLEKRNNSNNEDFIIPEVEYITSMKSYYFSISKLAAILTLPTMFKLYTRLDGSSCELPFMNRIKKLEIEATTPDDLISFHCNIINMDHLEELKMTILYPEREQDELFLNEHFDLPKLKRLKLKTFAGHLDIIYGFLHSSKILESFVVRFNQTGLFNLNLALRYLRSRSLKILDIKSFQDDDNRRVSIDWEPDLESLELLKELIKLEIDGFNFTSNLKFFNELIDLEEICLKSTKDPEYSPILNVSSVINWRFNKINRNLTKLQLEETFILSSELINLKFIPNLKHLKLNSVILKQFFNFNFLDSLEVLDVTLMSDRYYIDSKIGIADKNIGWPKNLKNLKIKLVSNDERKKFHSLESMLDKLSIMKLPNSLNTLELSLDTTSKLGKESIFNRDDLHINDSINLMMPSNLKHLKLVGLDKYFPQWQWWNMKFLINSIHLNLPKSLESFELQNAFIEGSFNLPNLEKLVIKNSFFTDGKFLNSNFLINENERNITKFNLNVYNCCFNSNDINEIMSFNDAINFAKFQKKKPEEVFLWRHDKKIYLLNGPIIKSAVMI